MANGAYNWRAGTIRSANEYEAHPQRMTATDGSTRYALGRTVKGERTRHYLPGGGSYVTSEPVEVWTLRHRVNGKIVTVKTGVDRVAAVRWVSGWMSENC